MTLWMTHASLFGSAEALHNEELVVGSELALDTLVALLDLPAREGATMHTPLLRCWTGYENILAAYYVAMQTTLATRGISPITNNVFYVRDAIKSLGKVEDVSFVQLPWLADKDVLRSHRSNLMRRWPLRYSFPKTPLDMPYIWPFISDDGYELKLSKYDKELLALGERKLPSDIKQRISQ